MNDLDELKPVGNTSSRQRVNWKLSDGTTKVHYVPWANIIFNAGYDKKTVYVRKYDFEQELKATGEDYLFVDSLPPFLAFKNIAFRYQLSCKTNSDSVTYELSEGPAGMKISKEGLLSWTPRRGLPVGMIPVVVTIKSSNGDEYIHTFELALMPDTKKRR